MRLPDPSNSYATLVGTSTYRSAGLPALPAVRHNLDDLHAILTDPGLGGLPAEHCVVVPDPADVRTVYRELQRQAARATDTLIVYFAGHGLTGIRNELFLGLTDTDTAELPVSALAYDLVRGIIADSPARNRVVILDCCFSGRAAGDMAGEAAILGQVGIEGTYVLTSTQANAVALAPPGARHTAFTGELLRLLRAGVPEGPELLTFGTIYRHLLHTMTSRGLPRPQQRGTGTADLLALTRNPAHAEPAPAEPAPAEPAPPEAAPPEAAPAVVTKVRAPTFVVPAAKVRDAAASAPPDRAGPVRHQRIWRVSAGLFCLVCTVLATWAWTSSTWRGTQWIDIVTLTLVQGLSQNSPVSAYAHLTLAEAVFVPNLAGLIALVPATYFAATAALLAYLAGDVWRALRATAKDPFLRRGDAIGARLGWFLVLGVCASSIWIPIMRSIPLSANLWVAVTGLAATAIMLGLAERTGRKQREISSFTVKDGLVIGVLDLVSWLLPGLSPLGVALATGLMLGFTRSAALRLALLLELMTGLTVQLYLRIDDKFATPEAKDFGPTTTQMQASTLTVLVLSYAVVAGLFWYVRRRSFYPFAAYLLALAALTAGALANGVISAT